MGGWVAGWVCGFVNGQMVGWMGISAGFTFALES